MKMKSSYCKKRFQSLFYPHFGC